MPDLLLDKFGDGEQILATTYSGGETAGVSILVVISCFSLVAVVGLLVIMAVGIYFSAGLAPPLTNVLFFTTGFCVVQQSFSKQELLLPNQYGRILHRSLGLRSRAR